MKLIHSINLDSKDFIQYRKSRRKKTKMASDFNFIGFSPSETLRKKAHLATERLSRNGSLLERTESRFRTAKSSRLLQNYICWVT